MPLTSKGGDDAPLFFAASIMPSLGFVILGENGGGAALQRILI